MSHGISACLHVALCGASQRLDQTAIMDWFTSSNGYVNFDDVAQGQDREFLVVGASYY